MDCIKKELIEIVGTENVIDDAQVLSSYAGDNSFAKPIIPRFVVKPQNADQVEKLVKLANENKTPLIPVSSGAPHYKSDTVPSVPGAIIVDLSGMKKIINVNRTYRIAIIEPGVTYGELQEALKKERMTLSTCLAPRTDKSVVGSVLETEPRLNSLHQWCFLDPLRCMEVIWGDGNRMYTGEAGGAVMDLEKQWKEEKWQWEPAGPMMLDFYRMLTGAQGTMGIVTWASVRCEHIPQAHKMYLVPCAKIDDLIDFAYKVLRVRFSDEFFIMNAMQLASLIGKDANEIKALREELPPFVALVGIAGRDFLPEERVAAQEQDIAEIAQISGLKMLPAIPGARGEDVLEKAINPSGEIYWKETFKGAFQDIFFETTLDKTPEFIEVMYKLAQQEGYPLCDIGIYIQPQNMGTSCHCSFTLTYDPDNKQQASKVEKLFNKASSEFSVMGAYYLRPYGIWSQLQLNKDVQSYKSLQQLKGIFDPNGIMNPGKLSNN